MIERKSPIRNRLSEIINQRSTPRACPLPSVLLASPDVLLPLRNQLDDSTKLCTNCGLDLAPTTPVKAVAGGEVTERDIVREALAEDFEILEELGRGEWRSCSGPGIFIWTATSPSRFSRSLRVRHRIRGALPARSAHGGGARAPQHHSDLPGWQSRPGNLLRYEVPARAVALASFGPSRPPCSPRNPPASD